MSVTIPASDHSPITRSGAVVDLVVPTGCDEHANRYAIYAVDSRQALHALAGEPRFLSIAPDMGLVSLTAADDLTFPDIKALARTYARTRHFVDDTNKNADDINLDRIAFLTVTSTWFQSTFVENGILREDDQDGIITDYPESTAIWSRTVLNSPNATFVGERRYPEGCGSHPTGGGHVTNVHTAMDYRRCIDAAIRHQEALYTVNPQDGTVQGEFIDYEQWHNNDNDDRNNNSGTKRCFVCQTPARYGTDPSTARFHQILGACELEELMVQAGITHPENTGGGPKFPLAGCSLEGPRPPKSSSSWTSHSRFGHGGATRFLASLLVLAFSMGMFVGMLVARNTTSTQASSEGIGKPKKD